MLLIAHVAVGAAVGSAVGNPFVALVASFISYYILDSIPHSEIDTSKSNPKRGRNVLIAITDIVLSFIITILFALYIPEFINTSHQTNAAVYPFTLSTIDFHTSFHTFTFSPLIAVCCFLAMIPGLYKILFHLFVSEESNFLGIKNVFHRSDKSIWGKFVQISAAIVATLYAFRQLPNSDTPSFIQIIILMLFIVGTLSLMETFAVGSTKTN